MIIHLYVEDNSSSQQKKVNSHEDVERKDSSLQWSLRRGKDMYPVPYLYYTC
jgi:hypothetical protein